MLFSEDTFFSIGQFAKLHEINKKTLMWYDEIGLLKPAATGKNGYRYYTYRQSPVLETILMLRELGVSIRNIQEFLKNRSAASLEHLLEENIAEIDRTISRLNAVRKIMSDKQKDMISVRTLDLNAISIVEKDEPAGLVTVDISGYMSFEAEIEKVIAEAKKYQIHRFHDASYGAMLPAEKLYQGRTDEYEFLYIQMPDPLQKSGLHIPPGGKYLRAFCRGSWDKLPARYQEILSYAEKNRLRLYGYAYEKGINEIVIDTLDDYITQIEIPVKTEA